MTFGKGKRGIDWTLRQLRSPPRSHKDFKCLKRVLSTHECAEQSGETEWPGMYRGAMRAPRSQKAKEVIEQRESGEKGASRTLSGSHHQTIPSSLPGVPRSTRDKSISYAK